METTGRARAERPHRAVAARAAEQLLSDPCYSSRSSFEMLSSSTPASCKTLSNDTFAGATGFTADFLARASEASGGRARYESSVSVDVCSASAIFARTRWGTVATSIRRSRNARPTCIGKDSTLTASANVFAGEACNACSVMTFSRRRAMPVATRSNSATPGGTLSSNSRVSSMVRSIRAKECSGYWARYRCRTSVPGSKSMANALRTSSAVICGCLAITSSPFAQGVVSGTQRPCHDACGWSSPISPGLC